MTPLIAALGIGLNALSGIATAQEPQLPFSKLSDLGAWRLKPAPLPTLLVGYLRIADQACLQAIELLSSGQDDRVPLVSWTFVSSLRRAGNALALARLATVDPNEQVRLGLLADGIAGLPAEARRRVGAVPSRLLRTRGEVRRFAQEVQRRIELKRLEDLPLKRPPLNW